MKEIAILKHRLFFIIGSLVLITVILFSVINIRMLWDIQGRRKENSINNLQVYIETLNRSMEDIENMLISQDIEDVNLQNIRKPRKQLDRYLALLEKKAFFQEEIGKYNLLDGLFLYDKSNDTYIGVRGEKVSSEIHTIVKKNAALIIEQYDNAPFTSDWFVVQLGADKYIFRLFDLKGIYFCAWMKPENILSQMQQTKSGENVDGYYFLCDETGNILNKNEADVRIITGDSMLIDGKKYQVLTASQGDKGKFLLSYAMYADTWNLLLEQMISSVFLILFMGGLALVMLLVLTSEKVINPLYRIFVEEERERNQAQLQFLQIQSNPHFLNNCLSLVRNLIVLDRSREAEEVILKLGRFTRRFINSQAEIPLEQEFDYVKIYYELQKIRYEERLDLVVEVSEDVRSDDNMKKILVPVMSIQTFVENSIKHQMKLKDTLYILVRIYMAKNRQVVMEIRDNGKGFSNEVLEQLKNNQPIVDENGMRHIGIQNLIQRMMILYGEEASISFENDNGAIVTICIPEKEAMEKDIV